MKRTGNWFNDGPMRNRIFNKSSTGPPRPPRSPGYMRRMRAANLLRALLRERRIRRRYSIEKKSSCSNNFSNGGSTRRTYRTEPTLTPVLFAKASDKTRRRRFCVMQDCRLSPRAFMPAFCSTPRNQVQNGAGGDAEESDRADEGGEAGDGKTTVAAGIELPRTLHFKRQSA